MNARRRGKRRNAGPYTIHLKPVKEVLQAVGEALQAAGITSINIPDPPTQPPKKGGRRRK
jgi:hypothetical protein